MQIASISALSTAVTSAAPISQRATEGIAHLAYTTQPISLVPEQEGGGLSWRFTGTTAASTGETSRICVPATWKIRRFFIFIFFNFVSYKNIFFFSKFTGIYPGRSAAGRPAPGRPAAGWQGLFCKKFCGK